MLRQKFTKIHFIFLSAIPIFFVFSIVAMSLIETEEWVEIPSYITPSEQAIISKPENAKLIEQFSKLGDSVKKGDVIAKYQSDYLQQQLQQNEYELLKAQQDLVIKETEKKLLVNMLKEINTKEDVKEENSLELELAQQKINNLTTIVAHLITSQTEIKKNLEQLQIIAPIEGLLLQTPTESFIHNQSQKNSEYIIVKKSPKNITMYIPENQIIKIKTGARLRFAPATISIYESDYFWGEILNIAPLATPNKEETSTSFLVIGQLNRFANHSIEEKQNNLIPYGVHGKSAIGVGKKNLLKQFIGW